MPSERVQRQIDRLLDEAEQAMAKRDWAVVEARCEAALRLDAQNTDAATYLAAARGEPAGSTGAVVPAESATPSAPPLPGAFVGGRYAVTGLLGEGGKKLVYRAHDALLDRDVAFALIKPDGLDEAGRERVKREAQALGRLGSQPNIATVFELGEEEGQPYIVTELLSGGDLATLIAAAPDHRVPLPRVLELATGIGKALVYAHGKGVIHRDLKPGNVWLAEDGTPKLGDFGLAMAASDPRLTQAGMMVGTALYMAPEQATGGAVTPQSDLYSLGCLLYELACGRPPFVGDESVAIIGQHLSTTPVSPTWHRPDCPKPLEALILQLLAKDPAKRPTAAQDVVEVLAGISPSARRTTSESRQAVTTPSGQSPVYRRIFVGREAELKQLEAAFDAASAGQGGLVMVVGEPGIGKTTLTEQLATYAGLRGGRVLVGHCYEEGSLSLPYLPFVEAMRSYILDREPARLKNELGGAAPEVARLVSEVRDRVSVEPAVSPGDGGEDRYRLLQGVSSFLRNAAAAQPLVLVLEDVHDADRGTLDLLQFLARQLAGARLLVVGTYRDIEVDRQHPLSATLAELRRAASFSRVLLRGLTADEVQRMLSAIAGQDVPWGLAEGVHRQTEGNPLFVQEVLRYLAEEGLITREGGRWQRAGERSLLETIPEGLRDVIGKRLARLSTECNRVLALAAVIGREFALETLRALVDLPDDALLVVLEEALKVAVLQDVSRPGRGGNIRYRFAHAFFRQTLYEELITPRRLRLHQQVARALEQQYAGRLEEHAAELAEHFAQSSDPGELARAVQYGELAAERALRVYAYGEAARLLEQALAVQEVLDPDDRARVCDLLLALGEALIPAGEPLRAAETVAERAFGLAVGLADRPRQARACRLAMQGYRVHGGPPAVARPEYRAWGERTAACAAPGSAEEVRAKIALGEILARGRPREHARASALRNEALALARALDDPETLYWVAYCYLPAPAVVDQDRALELAEELAGRSRAGVSAGTLAQLLSRAAQILLSGGRRRQAEALGAELHALAERTRDPHIRAMSLVYVAELQFCDGAFEEVFASARLLVDLGEAHGMQGLALDFSGVIRGGASLALGRYEAVLDEAARIRSVRPEAGLGFMVAMPLAQLGRREEARARLAEILTLVGQPDGYHPTVQLALMLAAAILVEDVALVRELATALAPAAGLAALVPVNLCPARLLGDAMVLLGDRERARAYYQQALVNTSQAGCRPEVALTRLALAELVSGPAGPLSPNPGGTNAGEFEAERGLGEAREHLGFAMRELEAMGMAPALERAQALRERLGDGGAAVAAALVTAPAVSALPAEPNAALAPGRQVFISYGSKDLQRALALEALLRAEGFPVWLDKRSIPPGSSWDAEIVKGIRNSAVIAVLCSPEAVQSPHVHQELRLAMEFRKPLLPLILRPTAYPDEVKYILTGRQWVELLTRSEADWFADVLAAVRRLATAARS